ncbi:hypothetical protein [Streptomyces sp. NPDC091278]|uniref:hypothetical protein n=1 Tax=Streptomyces sp. NPDC091278 TaxID=3155301 RepID=UPI00344CB0CB
MAVRDRLAARELLVAWAEEHGLRQSSAGCCPRWLGRTSSHRCRDGACAREADPALDSYWMDHLVSWLADGRPAALTTAPYHFEDEDRERLRWWMAQDFRLRGAWGTGWYGCGTVQVVLWRADLLGKVMPAGPEARAEGFCGQGVL